MAKPDCDRNLLFGILAHHNGFITRDALIRAMSAWVAAKEVPLGRILERQGDLTPENHALMEALVRAHLKQHNDDPAQSLAAFSTPALARVLIDEVPDADVQASMSVPGSADVADDPTMVQTSGPAGPGFGTPTSSGRRFRVLHKHAFGGLGEVFVARDEELHREVALKQIKERYCTDPSCQTRFVAEAEITGGLEHPGVVPVYGLGKDERGRPYYAMRFIRGESLKEASDRFHKTRATKATTGEWAIELRKLLGRFIDVCEAIAYAHSRGVVHRDLKPGNIMLGPYGETLVVDWGLAKAVGRDDDATRANPDEATLRPSSGSDNVMTAAGSAIGTPAFMSPEQADGRIDEIGPASDVYGLGATLYYLLTGRTPFDGDTVGAIIRAVRIGAFRRPRQVDPSIPPALEAICLKAMAHAPAYRYPSAQALAGEIERWQADEPVSAYHERALQRAQRWARHHRAAMLAGVAALLVALVASVAIAGLLLVAARRERSLADRERKAKSLAVARLGQIEKADDLLASVFEDLNPNAEEKEGKPLRAILGDRLKAAALSLDGETIGDPLTVATIQHILGMSQRSLGNSAEAITLLTRASKTREARLGASHPDTLNSRTALAAAFLIAGRTKDAIALLESTLKLYKATLGPDDPDTLVCLGNLAMAYDHAGRFDEAIAIYEATLKVRLATLGPGHPDTLTNQNNLGTTYWSAGRTADAIKMHEATLKAREAAFGPNHPMMLLSRNNLAVAYETVGRTNDAIKLHEATLRGQEETLGPNHPETLTSRHNLASAFASAGRSAEAIKMHEATFKAREATLGPNHPDTLLSRNSLAETYLAAGQISKAIEMNEVTLKKRRAVLGPNHPETLTSQNNLAYAYSVAGRPEEAIRLHEATLKGRETALGVNHRDSLVSRNNLAIAYSNAGRMDEAIAQYTLALKALERELGHDHPNTLKCRNNLAVAYLDTGRAADAIPLFEAVLKSQEATRGPDHPDTLGTRFSLAGAYRDVGRTAEANTLHEAALKAMEEHLGPDHPTTLTCRNNLAQVYIAAGRLDEAIKMDEATLKSRITTLGPHHPHTIISRGNLASAYETAGKVAREETLLRDNVVSAREQYGRSDLQTAGTLAYLGLCLIRQAKWSEAETVVRECLAIREAADPTSWTTFNTRSMLGATLMEQGRYAAAEPLLISGFEGIKARQAMIPASHRTLRVSQAADRVLRLYDLWGKPSQAAEWKARFKLPDLPEDVFSRP